MALGGIIAPRFARGMPGRIDEKWRDRSRRVPVRDGSEGVAGQWRGLDDYVGGVCLARDLEEQDFVTRDGRSAASQLDSSSRQRVHAALSQPGGGPCSRLHIAVPQAPPLVASSAPCLGKPFTRAEGTWAAPPSA
jgi:hypothetical protein